jgi:hypothetical protein
MNSSSPKDNYINVCRYEALGIKENLFNHEITPIKFIKVTDYVSGIVGR